MKRRLFTGMVACIIAFSLAGCGDNAEQEISAVENEPVAVEPVQEATEEPVEEIVEEPAPGFVEPQGQITSGIGAVDGTDLYYAINGGGCHTGIIKRDIESGSETEIISNEGTNGFSNLSIYDGYIYCTWDKYLGTDDSDYEIYRFSLENFAGEKLADGCMPIVADRTVYYWKEEWTDGGDSWAKYTLYNYNVDTGESSEVGEFGAIAYGMNDTCYFNGIYDCFYLDGKVYIEVAYDSNGKSGVYLYDLEGNLLDQSNYDIEYISWNDNGSKYGVDTVYNKTEIVGDGKMVIGIKGSDEVCNYIDVNGNITTLQTWEPAE